MAVAIVVDGNEEDLQSSLIILNSTGMFDEVHGFSCPEAAYLFVEENGCDVIFVETEISGMNCFILMDKLEKIKKDIIQIIMTTDKNYAFEAFQKGVMDYVIKPLSPEGMEKVLDKLRKYLIWTKKIPTLDDNFL